MRYLLTFYAVEDEWTALPHAERVALSALLLEAHVLADRVSATDAFYLALARARGVELFTTDAHLAQGGGTLAQIRLIAPA